MNLYLVGKTCALCSNQALYGVVLAPVEVLSCDEHYKQLYSNCVKNKRFSLCDLGQTTDRWTHTDKKTGRVIKHRLTRGKDVEIRDRVISKEDPKVVLNGRTGKETQY